MRVGLAERDEEWNPPCWNTIGAGVPEARSWPPAVGSQAGWDAEVARPIQEFKAEFFKALSHPARIRVLEVLGAGEQSVGELVPIIGLEASHLSQQLGVLRRAGLVVTRKEGPSVFYSLADRRMSKLLELTKQILLTYLTEARDLLTEPDRVGVR